MDFVQIVLLERLQKALYLAQNIFSIFFVFWLKTNEVMMIIIFNSIQHFVAVLKFFCNERGTLPIA